MLLARVLISLFTYNEKRQLIEVYHLKSSKFDLMKMDESWPSGTQTVISNECHAHIPWFKLNEHTGQTTIAQHR